MAKKKIEVEVGTKNNINVGLERAKSSIKKFGADISKTTAMIRMPLMAAGVIAAVIVKALDAVMKKLAEIRAAARKDVFAQMAAKMATLKQETELSARMFERWRNAVEMAAKGAKEHVTTTRQMADAQLKFNAAMKMANAENDEAREAIKDELDAAQAAAKHAQNIEDLTAKQSELNEAIQAGTTRQKELAAEMNSATQAFKNATTQAAKLREEAGKKTSGRLVTKWAQDEAKEMRELAKQYDAAAKEALAQVQKLEGEKYKLSEQSKQAAIDASEIPARIEAANIAEAARLINENTERKIKAAEREKKLIDEITRAREDAAKAQGGLEREMQDKQLDGWEKQLDAAKKIAGEQVDIEKAKVADVIALNRKEAEDKKKQARQEAKDAKKAEILEKRLRDKGAIGKRAQEFLDARRQLVAQREAAKVAQQNIQAIQKGREEARLKELNDELKKHNAKLDALLVLQ